MDARDNPSLIAAVNAIADDEASGRARSIVVARGVERLRPFLECDESHAEKCRRENAAALVAMESGSTPMKVARGMWPKHPSKHHRYAQRFRRLLREINAHCARGAKTTT